MLHPTPDRLEAYVEEALPDAERAVLESHLEGCGRCRTEVEEWRALFTALETLPAFEPASGFTERVMAQVRLPVPWWARLVAMVTQLAPRSTFGWVLVAGLVSVPALTAGGAVAWLLTRPAVSPQALWVLFTQGATQMAGSGADWVLARLMGTDAAALALTAVAWMQEAGTHSMASAAALFATLTVTSAWILYTNLIRPDTRGRGYASYSF